MSSLGSCAVIDRFNAPTGGSEPTCDALPSRLLFGCVDARSFCGREEFGVLVKCFATVRVSFFLHVFPQVRQALYFVTLDPDEGDGLRLPIDLLPTFGSFR